MTDLTMGGGPAGGKPQGRFITFEGGEGAGKSTQIRRLADHLRDAGRSVTITREPGGSDGAEAIRSLLVTGEPGRWGPLSEVFLLAAARADHLARTIGPALARGDVVLCDRFMDSTTAYQGHGHGLDLGTLNRIHDLTVGATRPDLTLILDLPAAEGLARAQGRSGSEDRFERMDIGFHERLREGFLAIAEAEPKRCVVLDARESLDAVDKSIWRAVADRLPDLARPRIVS